VSANRAKRPRREIFACPHCGADVPIGSRSCRECGSDASTGWQDQEDIDYAAVDLPDGYRDERAGDALGPPRRRWWWVAVALVLVVAFAVMVIARR
jgi:ribosomal protein L40E